jgi:hypothetical protein
VPETPEQKARREIDAKLIASGWLVQDRDEIDLTAGRGIAVREFPMKSGFGFADYLLYLDRKALGAVEAKAEGTLTGVEAQSAKYAAGLPDTGSVAARTVKLRSRMLSVQRGRFALRLEARASAPLARDAKALATMRPLAIELQTRAQKSNCRCAV